MRCCSATTTFAARTSTGKRVARFAPEKDIERAAFTDATHLLTYGGDQFLTWDVGVKAPLRSFAGPVAEQLATAFSPRGFPIAAALGDGTVALWDPASTPVLRRLRGHTGPVTTVAFSRDGRRRLSSPDGYVEFFGADAEALRRLTRCVLGQRALPFEVCAERFETPGLFAKVMANDMSYQEP